MDGDPVRPEAPSAGLTLVELLVVIVILTMVTAATIPLMAPVTSQRKVRESAPPVGNDALAGAGTRTVNGPAGRCLDRAAIATSWRISRTNTSLDLFLCEVPPPYSGESTTAGCRIGDPAAPARHGTGRALRRWASRDAPAESDPPGRSCSIQLSRTRLQDRRPRGRRRVHQRSAVYHSTAAFINAPAGGNANAALPYQIFRQPVKSADSPATLPVGALIDLQWSGIGNTRDFAVSTPADPILDGAASVRASR